MGYPASKTPHYDRVSAIKRTVEASAGGQDRVLLVMDIDSTWRSLDNHAT